MSESSTSNSRQQPPGQAGKDNGTSNGTGNAGAPGSGSRQKLPVWLSRTILIAVAVIVLVIGYFIASLTVPLAWANSIKDQVGNNMGNAIPLGMFYGSVFSFVPILVAWQAHHRKLHKVVRIALVVLGVLLTIPNLLTLGVLYGTTKTAHNALSIWNTGGANWFGTWSQSFMIIGVLCAIAVIILGRVWLHRGKKIRDIKAAQKLLADNDQRQPNTRPTAGPTDSRTGEL